MLSRRTGYLSDQCKRGFCRHFLYNALSLYAFMKKYFLCKETVCTRSNLSRSVRFLTFLLTQGLPSPSQTTFFLAPQPRSQLGRSLDSKSSSHIFPAVTEASPENTQSDSHIQQTGIAQAVASMLLHSPKY